MYLHLEQPFGRALSHAFGFACGFAFAFAFGVAFGFAFGFAFAFGFDAAGFTFTGARHAHSRGNLWQNMYHDLRGCNRSM